MDIKSTVPVPVFDYVYFLALCLWDCRAHSEAFLCAWHFMVSQTTLGCCSRITTRFFVPSSLLAIGKDKSIYYSRLNLAILWD